jgi:hypothetical protein
MKTKLFTTVVYNFMLLGLGCSNENESVSSNHLAGTIWKLEGFVDVGTGNLKVAEPNDPKCYILTFDTDSTISGTSSTNGVSGIYSVNYEKSTLCFIAYGGTKRGEVHDGYLFVNSFRAVQSFSLSDTALRLYYNDGKNYLLFKAKE